MISFESLWERAESHTQLIADAANDMIMPIPLAEPSQRWLWLTVPNCGFAVEVLRQQLEREEIDAHAVVNRGVTGKRFQDHTLLAVPGEDETVFIDPTYLQLFSNFGVDAHLVAESWRRNEGDILPVERCLAYTESMLTDLVDWLSGQTLWLLKRYQHSSMWQTAERSDERPLSLSSTGTLRSFFTPIYDPQNFEPFCQTPEKQEPIAEYLDDYKPGRISVNALFRLYAHRAGKLLPE